MELDSKNIKRLMDVFRGYVKNNWRTLLVRFVAYTYLFGIFCFIALYYSYNVRVSVKPLSYFFIVMTTLCIYLLYVIINHLLVRIVVPHKILLIFDLLTFMMLACISMSDSWVENCIRPFVICGA